MAVSFCGLLALGLAQTARAEVVLVQSGQSAGQGWVFAHEGACWTATAGHVVLDDAGVLVFGRDGQQATGTEVRRHESLDLAYIRLAGTLATRCPHSSLGDRDSRPELRRLLQEGRVISLEKRVGGNLGEGGYGTDIIPVEVVAISEAESSFTIRPLRADEDAIVQSDSGSPIRMRGTGVLEAGRPLGLVIADLSSVEAGYVQVIRMDVVREGAEGLLSTAKAAKPGARSADFTISEFYGRSVSSDCGPANILSDKMPCGWRVKREGDYPAIVLALDRPAILSGVEMTFAENAGTGLVIVTDLSQNSVRNERPCRAAANSTRINCSLGDWQTDQVKLLFVGELIELISVRMLEK